MSYLLCLHRWVGKQALYDDYAVPDGLHVKAICSQEAVSSLPNTAKDAFSVVETMDDSKAVQKAAKEFARKFGSPSQIVALNEGDLLNAAELREHFALAGDDMARTQQFRDKLIMNQIAAEQRTVNVLAAQIAESEEQVFSFAETHGYPVVVKPRRGTASRRVEIVYGPSGYPDSTEHLQSEPMMVQTFLDAPILHVDGWWDGKDLVVGRASRYLNDCKNFGENSPLGSVELPPGEEESRVLDATTALLKVFSPYRELVFHLELFEAEQSYTFLEIGARVGGAEIPFIWRDIHGIDLTGIAWEIQTGASQSIRNKARAVSQNQKPLHSTRGGWVIARKSIEGISEFPSVYWSSESEANGVAASGVYEGAATRLRLQNGDPAALLRDARHCVKHLSSPEATTQKSRHHSGVNTQKTAKSKNFLREGC